MTHQQVKWDRSAAAHLYRRAAFGATPAELDRAVSEGLEATVDRLTAFPPSSDELPDTAELSGIIQWWIGRFLRTDTPLRERMTFFWHDHFATSIATVMHPGLMLQQNRLFRAHALGNTQALATAIARDPAMLLWLDNYVNVKEHPNENFGRELLELFLLGLGHYAEGDVLAAARAFTGWGLTNETRNAAFVFHEAAHDDDRKQLLGRAGLWDGGDIVRIACHEPAHSRFFVRKLFAYFAHGSPDEAVVNRLAHVYRSNDCEVRPVVRAILTSAEMYSARAIWSQVKSPLDHAVIACRQLGMRNAHPATIADALNAQGLTLFAPPDVSGWKKGMSWINGWTLLVRFGLAATIARTFDPATVADGAHFSSPRDVVDFYLRLLGPLHVSANTHRTLVANATRVAVANGDSHIVDRNLVRIILSLPEWQLN